MKRTDAIAIHDPLAGDAFASRLLAWFDQHGRHDLPWQHPRTPYRVWLSEIMLQQTQVATVIPYFQRFVDALPELGALAAAPLDRVLGLWSGLGYYSRARNLHAAARICVEKHGGALPEHFDDLLALPGIGRSTAAAILAQAWNHPRAILDGNVKRVLSRLHAVDGWPGLPAVEKTLWALAAQALPTSPTLRARMADYTQAQMDFGATVCTRARPRCDICVFAADCHALRQQRTGELPAPRPRKPLPQRETHMLWLRDSEGRSLLQRRPAQGVWASLWSLPEAEDEAGIDALRLRHARNASDVQSLAGIDHVFSHYRLRIRPLRVDGVPPVAEVGDNDGMRWFTRDQWRALGIPAPVRRLLEEET
ncbi:A/G-specific adenine glycosylase [Luteimonas sp. e5]